MIPSSSFGRSKFNAFCLFQLAAGWFFLLSYYLTSNPVSESRPTISTPK